MLPEITLSSVALPLTDMGMEASRINIIQNTLLWNSLLSHWYNYMSLNFRLCFLSISVWLGKFWFLDDYHWLLVIFFLSTSLWVKSCWSQHEEDRGFFSRLFPGLLICLGFFSQKLLCQPRPTLTKHHFTILYQRTIHVTQQCFS